MPETNTILCVNGLQVTFAGDNPFTPVNNISFSVGKGKTVAIVGESGSGKSLTALAIIGLLPKTATQTGDILLQTTNHQFPIPNSQFQKGKDLGMVFQEPMSSLNPVMKIGKQLAEAMRIHRNISAKEGRQLAIDWLGKVQLPDPVKMYDRYSHQLSGGQKQRVMIAMAMCNHPALLIADEPTTALDVTVQQEIIRLMHFLQQEHQSAMIFITHDLSLAATIADEVLVMYKGQTMEYGPASQVLKHPQHPYTKALLACRPSPEQKGHRLPIVADFLDGNKTTDLELKEQPHGKVITENVPLLSVNNLRVWFAEEEKHVW